jgi:hypothetical protein
MIPKSSDPKQNRESKTSYDSQKERTKAKMGIKDQL